MAKRIRGGYEIPIEGANVLRVYDTGVVEDVSGAPVSRSDVTIAMGYLPSELRNKVWAWWNQPGHR